MKDVVSKYTLPEICIFQWKRCVDLTDSSMEVMDRNRVHEIEYRSFIQDPVVELGRITKFIGLNVPPEVLKKATSFVSMDSVGKGRKSLGEEEIRRMEALAHDTLQRHGYA